MAEFETRTERNQKSRSRGREIRSWIICILIAVVIALLLRTFVFEIVRVDGQSMEPTLHSDQHVFVEKVTRYFNGIDRGNIVITKYPGYGDLYVKRVIALGGDTIEVKGGSVFVNGAKVEESYIAEPIEYEFDQITIPENYVFVMGDNRNHSTDSHIIGAIEESNIVGHALFVIWPLDEWELLTGK